MKYFILGTIFLVLFRSLGLFYTILLFIVVVGIAFLIDRRNNKTELISKRI